MIKTKQELLNHFSDINEMYNNPFMYQTLSNMIDELLEQEPKTGHWIENTYESSREFWDRTTECSECGYKLCGGMPNYCPNCGARMEVDE